MRKIILAANAVISLGVTFILLSICTRYVGAEETDRQELPPIQFVGGDTRFTAANQERVDLVTQIPDRVTAYVNGLAEEVWVENPKASRFYQHAYRAWQQGQLAAMDGIQPGEDVNYPKDQFFRPPEDKPVETRIIEQTSDRVVRLETYPFTRVEATYQVQPDGTLGKALERDLVAVKSNPYYFGFDIYAPKSIEEGGPFTIGRVIHSNRQPTLSAWIGGVAVFDRALSDDEMKRLATIGNCSGAAQ